MVSPHPEWDDCTGGLLDQDTKIGVSPVNAWFDEYSTVVRPADAGEGNAYSVRVYHGPDRETHNDVVVFRDARPAWEFAHLLTHYFAHTTDPKTATNHLIRSERGSTDDQWNQSQAVEDLGAEEVLEKLLSPNPIPEAMDGILS
ncbi:hypothetical protein [Halocatena pleomorpha]|uniref:Uncharacterized protein n=1 Tax=Halocatena pleomorpha TaxID=1785090 RepID=A0A3P3RG23_9EURY|nr:hypothetical protein [Halocatena pleomorpha]RRJ32361.1 hypothetical protein EIK79_05060 [Halocatena pleomorpha]